MARTFLAPLGGAGNCVLQSKVARTKTAAREENANMPTVGFYIELKVEPDTGTGAAYVRSDQVPGLHLIGRCFKDMKPMIELAIKRLFRDNYRHDVNVVWLADAQTFPLTDNVLEKLVVFATPLAA